MRPDRDLSGSRLAHARQAFSELALSIAGYTRQAEDLSGMDFQVQPVQSLGAAIPHGLQPPDLQHDRPGLDRSRFELFEFTTHHHLHQLIAGHLARRSRADHPAVAQNGDAVADVHHLVQLVRDEDQRMAFLHHAPQRCKQIIDFLRGKDCGWLIEDDQPCAAVQRFHDLHPLLFANGKLPYVGARIHLEAVCARQFPDAARHFIEIQQRLTRRTQPKSYILGDGQGGHQHKMLMDHADPDADGIGRGMERLCLAVNENFAFIGLIEAIQLPHQRALAGAVFSK